MLLKELLFNKDTITEFAELIEKVYPDFKTETFITSALINIKPKELKERITVLRLLLETYLPKDYMEATTIITEVMDFAPPGKFVYGAMLEYIEFNGCNDSYIDYTLDLLKEYTKTFSAEFVIRRFINEHEEKIYQKLITWSLDDNHDVRRLVSEGLRPKLPWAVKINIDYKKAATPLNNLYYDDVRYVTRSVANHLNDISKIDPNFVLDTLSNWKKEKKQKPEEMTYIINHSLRTLIKKGHKETLAFLGYKQDIDVTCSNLTLVLDTIKIGDSLEFQFELLSNEDTKIVVDYKIIYPSLTKTPSKKVYKLKDVTIKKKKLYTFKGKRSFKLISTRNIMAGSHTLIIQINGIQYAETQFNVTK